MFHTQKNEIENTLAVHNGLVQISNKFKDCQLPSAIAFTADLRFSYMHINHAPKAVDVFTGGISMFHFFHPDIKNLKLCPFVTNDLFENVIGIANI